jgi:mannose-6-phosphate isomerase-like protein (cupin superfamily)
MQSFQLTDLLAAHERDNQRWREFLRVPALSMGLYRLKAGQPDPQRPHTEDEVYYVLTGRAAFLAGTDQQPVGPGTILFVQRGLEHRFCNITEDLAVLVFFAPAEGSLAHQPEA